MNRNNCRGLTLIECLLAVVVLGVLASLLLERASDLRKDAMDAQCRSQLRQWGEAVLFYAAENDGYYALRHHWPNTNFTGGISPWPALQTGYSPYIGLGEGVRSFLRTCPAQEGAHPGEVSYAMNWPSVDGWLAQRHRVPLYAASEASEFPLLMDSSWEHAEQITFSFKGNHENPEEGAPSVFALTQTPLDEQRHLGEMNAVFADGHVRRIHWEPRRDNDPDSMVAQWSKWTSIEIDP